MPPKTEKPALDIVMDPVQSAKAARLRYVTDNRPGIRREKMGEEFRYIGPDGEPVTDEATLERIKSLGIPPAYTDVWICPLANGHLQATGRDARGRKQYRYHPRWRAVRDETKYERMIAFGEALPRIRARVEEDLARPGMSREKILATVVQLLETTSIRVGNEEYARTNQHYGLTTLRTEHVDVEGSKIRFHFTGKSGKEHEVDLRDRRLARIIKRCQELPGHELFQYVDEDGERRVVHSDDVNEYLHEIAGEEFTAKDFRTWAGTIYCALCLLECEACDRESEAKKNVVQAIRTVSERLGNTPTVCRKCYVHPAVIDSYLDGTMRDLLGNNGEATALGEDESAVMRLLRQRLAKVAEPAKKAA
jgi:DNA topoisomerase-1